MKINVNDESFQDAMDDVPIEDVVDMGIPEGMELPIEDEPVEEIPEEESLTEIEKSL